MFFQDSISIIIIIKIIIACHPRQYTTHPTHATHASTPPTPPTLTHHPRKHATHATHATTSPTQARQHVTHTSTPPTPPALARIARHFSNSSSAPRVAIHFSFPHYNRRVSRCPKKLLSIYFTIKYDNNQDLIIIIKIYYFIIKIYKDLLFHNKNQFIDPFYLIVQLFLCKLRKYNKR